MEIYSEILPYPWWDVRAPKAIKAEMQVSDAGFAQAIERLKTTHPSVSIHASSSDRRKYRKSSPPDQVIEVGAQLQI